MLEGPSVVLVTGVMAAGKSTVAEALANRLPVAAHVRGDSFRRAIVSGRAEMTNPLSDAARAQLRVRQRIAAQVADEYARSGISAVVQDLYLGDDLQQMAAMIGFRPLYVVVLVPRPEVIEERERQRAKRGYGSEWTPAGFDRHLREETPRLGLWLDTAELSVAETVDRILELREQARVE